MEQEIMKLVKNFYLALKGLSHEIDFKNFDEKFTEPGLSKGRNWFLNFLGAPMIL